MKIHRLTQGFVLALLLSFTACTPEKYTTYIIGRWQPEKIGNYDIYPSTLAEDSEQSQHTSQDNQALDQLKQAIYKSEQNQKGITVTDLDAMFKTASMESETSYTLFERGKGIRKAPGSESTEINWQLKKRGKLLVISGRGISKRIKFNIDSLSMTKMVVNNQSNLPRGMKLTYSKQ